jgi:thioredoxin reductase (NADPH)
MPPEFFLPQIKKETAVEFDVAIIGAGPGGLTAGIYASRARLSTVILERNTAGGIMAITERVENYPGFPEGISGWELGDKMKQQAVRFGTDLREITTVTSIERRSDGTWTIVTDEQRITARAVILAPGVEARKLGIPGEAEFLGRGVSYCATCDGALYRDKKVAVIGGGDSAVEEGMFLAKFADVVYVLHRRDQLRAQKIIQEHAFANPKMKFIWNAKVQRIAGEGKVEGVDYQDVHSAVVTSLPVDGVFFYVGQIPNTAFLQGLVDLDEYGYILTDERMMTSQPGLFAIGDARAGRIKQIAWATGEGALAAIEAERYLDALECPSLAAQGLPCATTVQPSEATVDAAEPAAGATNASSGA